jgi:7,8-dihydroneopterin aldolase/epimerase/oxygenase
LPSDRISLTGMVFYGYHGVSPEERSLGQRFVVDLDVEADLRPAGLSDELPDTVSYTRLFNAVRGVVEGSPRKLLEAVAEATAGAVLEAFPVSAVRVRVTKPAPPIKGAVLDAAAVEVYRRRDGVG